MNKRHIKWLLATLTVLIALPTCCIWSFTSSAGHAPTPDQSPISNLPADARDIHWFFPGAFGPSEVYNFAASERSYHQWAQHNDLSNFDGPIVGEFTVAIYDHTTKTHDILRIKNAIAYTWSEEDRGEHYVFDRDANRAYYYYHSR